ncbi:IS66 family insertion sequence element accessory protein TnpB [Rhizobium beringeri]
MFRLADDLRVYLHRDPIDFRAGINSLAILVEQSMGLSPFERAVFVFCNRRRTRMKLLFFERSGFVLVLKALSEDRFRWPRREAPVVTSIPNSCAGCLTASISTRWCAIPVRQYEFVG